VSKSPLVLISPDIETKGKEFGDLSISLSGNYQQALIRSGAIPVALAATRSPELIAETVRRCDGVLLTGGDDVDPRLYANGLPTNVRSTIETTPDGGERDYRELLLVVEVFRQRKPLLAICRGHQMLNVALGGTLIADLGLQMPNALDHRRMAERSQVVHDARLTPGSFLAKITGRQRLGVNSTHHQAVGRVAPPLQVTATSPDGVVEGMELKGNRASLLPFLLAVQFHPERLADRYAEHQAIFHAFAQACLANRNNNL